MRTPLVASFLLLLASIVMIACNSDGESSLREDLRVQLQPLQEKLSFELLLPDYLPEGTRPAAVTSSRSPDGANLWFQGAYRTDVPVEHRADVTITESSAPSGDIAAADVDSSLSIEGYSVVVSRTPISNSQPAMNFHFATEDDISVNIVIYWFDEDKPLTLTPEMEDQALRIVRSVVSDAG